MVTLHGTHEMILRASLVVFGFLQNRGKKCEYVLREVVTCELLDFLELSVVFGCTLSYHFILDFQQPFIAACTGVRRRTRTHRNPETTHVRRVM